MESNSLETKYNALVKIVSKMRLYQRQYFAHRCSTDLQAAKKLERECDMLLKNDEKEVTPTQPKLFS